MWLDQLKRKFCQVSTHCLRAPFLIIRHLETQLIAGALSASRTRLEVDQVLHLVDTFLELKLIILWTKQGVNKNLFPSTHSCLCQLKRHRLQFNLELGGKKAMISTIELRVMKLMLLRECSHHSLKRDRVTRKSKIWERLTVVKIKALNQNPIDIRYLISSSIQTCHFKNNRRTKTT
jgi:hypothetical protein